jgi:hypothetical protein
MIWPEMWGSSAPKSYSRSGRMYLAMIAFLLHPS